MVPMKDYPQDKSRDKSRISEHHFFSGNQETSFPVEIHGPEFRHYPRTSFFRKYLFGESLLALTLGFIYLLYNRFFGTIFLNSL